MHATLPTANTNNALNHHGEKPHYMTLVLVDRATGHQPVTASVWASTTGATSYASIWAYSRTATAAGHSYSGAGRAGGCGYHRASAALDAAIDSAGITLSEDIAGAGTRAMEDACRAIATAMGYNPAGLVLVTVGG